jgi:hypothetical protein
MATSAASVPLIVPDGPVLIDADGTHLHVAVDCGGQLSADETAATVTLHVQPPDWSPGFACLPDPADPTSCGAQRYRVKGSGGEVFLIQAMSWLDPRPVGETTDPQVTCTVLLRACDSPGYRFPRYVQSSSSEPDSPGYTIAVPQGSSVDDTTLEKLVRGIHSGT